MEVSSYYSNTKVMQLPNLEWSIPHCANIRLTREITFQGNPVAYNLKIL
jgi:hypothetical protein